jgi:hypothetical protein
MTPRHDGHFKRSNATVESATGGLVHQAMRAIGMTRLLAVTGSTIAISFGIRGPFAVRVLAAAMGRELWVSNGMHLADRRHHGAREQAKRHQHQQAGAEKLTQSADPFAHCCTITRLVARHKRERTPSYALRGTASHCAAGMRKEQAPRRARVHKKGPGEPGPCLSGVPCPVETPINPPRPGRPSGSDRPRPRMPRARPSGWGRSKPSASAAGRRALGARRSVH